MKKLVSFLVLALLVANLNATFPDSQFKQIGKMIKASGLSNAQMKAYLANRQKRGAPIGGKLATNLDSLVEALDKEI